MRSQPNIVLTGTPGVGKTSHCEMLSERLRLRHLSVNQIVKEKECHEGWDEEFSSWIVDEDKVSLISSHLVQGGPSSRPYYEVLERRSLVHRKESEKGQEER